MMQIKKCNITWYCTLLFLFGISLLPAFGQGNTTPNPDIVVLKNIPYVIDGPTRQQLDLYLPKDYERAEKPYSLILVVHGGSWTRGSKYETVFIANWLVPKGYIVAINNYRFLKEVPFPAQLQDCKSAVRRLRANAAKYNIDNPDITHSLACQYPVPFWNPDYAEDIDHGIWALEHIPQQALTDGTFIFRWDTMEGERGSQVAELWIIKD